MAVLEETLGRGGAVLGGKRALKTTLKQIAARMGKLRSTSERLGRRAVARLDAKLWGKLEKRWKKAAAGK